MTGTNTLTIILSFIVIIIAIAILFIFFTIKDKGDTGPQGPQGPQGPTGPTGPTGPVGRVSIPMTVLTDSIVLPLNDITYFVNTNGITEVTFSGSLVDGQAFWIDNTQNSGIVQLYPADDAPFSILGGDDINGNVNMASGIANFVTSLTTQTIYISQPIEQN